MSVRRGSCSCDHKCKDDELAIPFEMDNDELPTPTPDLPYMCRDTIPVSAEHQTDFSHEVVKDEGCNCVQYVIRYSSTLFISFYTLSMQTFIRPIHWPLFALGRNTKRGQYKKRPMYWSRLLSVRCSIGDFWMFNNHTT